MEKNIENIKVVGLGDNTVDIYVDKNIYYPGGNCVNFSVFASRLGAESAYIGVIGNDNKGKHLRDSLQKEKVNIDRVRIMDSANSYAQVRHEGNNRIFIKSDPGLSQSLRPNDEDFKFLKDYNLVHTSIYSNINNYLRKMARNKYKISYDFADKFFEYNLDGEIIFPFIDYAFFSKENFKKNNINRFIKNIQDRYNVEVIITAGGEGSYGLDGKKTIHIPAQKINPVDTMGAGDAYITQYLLSRISGYNKKVAMIKGGEYASENCLNSGSFGYEHKL